jgi:hypothetical protein
MTSEKVNSKCGTEAGYGYHRNHWEKPCEACRSAVAKKVRKRRGVPDTRARGPRGNYAPRDTTR